MLSGLILSVGNTLAPPITFDPATVSNVTLSAGNLIATNTGTTSGDQGARVFSAFGKSTGKLYFEVKPPVGTGFGQQVGYGVGTTTSLYTDMGASALNGGMVTNSPGGGFWEVWGNGSDSGHSITFGNDSYRIASVAVDLDAGLFWSEEVSRFGHNWNGQVIGVSNPATGIGGVAMPLGLMVPMVTYGGASGITGISFRLNVGASAFAGPIPTGFIAWSKAP